MGRSDEFRDADLYSHPFPTDVAYAKHLIEIHGDTSAEVHEHLKDFDRRHPERAGNSLEALHIAHEAQHSSLDWDAGHTH